MYINTSKGFLEYKSQLIYFRNELTNDKIMLDNLRVLSFYLNNVGINWGPAFKSLISIIRNDKFLLGNPIFDIYILNENEEQFKDVLWLLIKNDKFELVHYERKGLYCIRKNDKYIRISIFHKISEDLRYASGSSYIFDKYLQNIIKQNFNGLEFSIPQKVDEFLTFQKSNWLCPKQTLLNQQGIIKRTFYWILIWFKNHLPDRVYYILEFFQRKKRYKDFIEKCADVGIPIPLNVHITSMKPLKHKKILTVGVYDLIHKGHVELFRRSKGLGDYLIVAVQDSDFILKYKPDAEVINSTEDRMYLVKSIRYVDEVITYTDVDKIVQEIKFDVFVTGPDQCHEGFQKAIRWCEKHGKEHIILGRTVGVSSSGLKIKMINKHKKV